MLERWKEREEEQSGQTQLQQLENLKDQLKTDHYRKKSIYVVKVNIDLYGTSNVKRCTFKLSSF